MTELGFRRSCYATLVILTLIAIFSALHVTRDGLRIDTNLKSLSPPLSQNKAINEAVDAMTVDNSKKIIIVIAGEDADEVDEAGQTLKPYCKIRVMKKFWQQRK